MRIAPIVSIVVVCVAAAAVLVTWWTCRQASYVPDFYTEVTKEVPIRSGEASRQLQREVEQLQSHAAKIGTWRAAFSDAQVNAWLIEELPQKFPRLLAHGAKEPRIVINDDHILGAVRYQNGHIDTVISCQVNVELTKQPNMLAIRVSNLRAGAIPLPLGNFMRGISSEAARGGLDVRWDMTGAGPVALVTVPSEDPRYAASPVLVESVNFVRGAMYLSGHTGEKAAESFQPDGTIHQFVSYEPLPARTQGDRSKLSRQHSRLSRSPSRSSTTVR